MEHRLAVDGDQVRLLPAAGLLDRLDVQGGEIGAQPGDAFIRVAAVGVALRKSLLREEVGRGSVGDAGERLGLPAAQRGIRALGGSAEYRVPLAMPGIAAGSTGGCAR